MMKSLLVFDIETIPDTDVCERLTGIQTNDISQQREALVNYHLEITDGKNPFLRQPFHKIIAISFLLSDISNDHRYEIYSLKEIRSGGNERSTESELIKGFLQLIKNAQSRLVSFNGRNFDLPVIKYRAMAYGIQTEYLHRSGDKWNNYTQRYSANWHCDLLDVLSDYGTSARIKMNEVCAAFKLPGKIGIDGSKVTNLYDKGEIGKIRDYCETDVLNTYLIYLRLMQHQGHITTIQHNNNIKELIHHLKQSQKYHLQEFHSEWNKSCQGNFFL